MMKCPTLSGGLSFGCFLGLVLFSETQAGPWPGFRGPVSSGVAEDAKPPFSFGPTSNLWWKAKVPKGHSSPIIWGESLFATGVEGKRLLTFCLDRRQGEKRGQQGIAVEQLEPVHGANSVATPTPVTDGRAVYAYFGSFGVAAYDFLGNELWRRLLPRPNTFLNQGTGTSPVLAEDMLLLFVQADPNAQLLALNPTNGQEIWRAPLPNPPENHPARNNTYGTLVYWKEKKDGCAGLVHGNRFTAFRLVDGQSIWWVTGLGSEACQTPVVAGDRLVLGAAGVPGEPANLTVPPPFEEGVRKHDQDGDGSISHSEIPPELLYTDRQATDGQGDVSLRAALSMFTRMRTGAKLNQAEWDRMRNGLREFKDAEICKAAVVSVRTGGKSDVTGSHVVWKETKSVPEVPSPLAYQGRVCLIRNPGMFTCRNLETGQLIYEKPAGSRGGYYASPIAAAGRVDVASDRGTVTVITAGGTFEVFARNELKERITASPAVVESALYIRSAEHLWAFRASEP